MSEKTFDLDQLRDEYLDNIDEELSNLENYTIQLENSTADSLEADLYQIFRIVHSIKGSAGSFEFYTLANIFHHFEDFISLKVKKNGIQEKIDLFLKFIDLAKKCLQDYRDNTHELKNYSDLIDNLSRNKDESTYKLLLIEPAKSIQKIFEKVGSEYKINVVSLTNGATAMNRVLTEKFDMIVSSLNIEILDGKSLLNAIKVMNCINNDVPLLLITSDENNLTSTNSYECLNKDHNLIKNIETHFKKSLAIHGDKKRLNATVQEMALEQKKFPFRNVFCCEDDKMVQMIIGKPFKEGGINLRFASDKNSIITYLKNNSPELILLDYFLIDCNGSEVLSEIITFDHLKEVPIIFMTSSPEKLDLNSMKKIAKIKGILEKPVKGNTLLKKIAQIAAS